MGRIIEVARSANMGSEEVLNTKYKTGEAIVKGTVLSFDANGELVVGSSTPATLLTAKICGVALEAAASKPGWDAANSPTQVTGRKQEVAYAVPNPNTVFQARGSADPAQTNVGVQYELAVSAGEWYVNFSGTTSLMVTVVDVDIPNKIVFFKFLPAAVE
jgi:hypothetical protein